MRRNLTSVAWGGEFAWWVLDDGACVHLSLALIIVIKFLGGGGYVQQALVSLSIGNGPLCPEDKPTHILPERQRGQAWLGGGWAIAGGGVCDADKTAAAVMAAGAVSATWGGACPRCVMLFAKVRMSMNALVAVVGLSGVGSCTNAVACSIGSVVKCWGLGLCLLLLIGIAPVPRGH
jgi:hypothetical protein